MTTLPPKQALVCSWGSGVGERERERESVCVCVCGHHSAQLLLTASAILIILDWLAGSPCNLCSGRGSVTTGISADPMQLLTGTWVIFSQFLVIPPGRLRCVVRGKRRGY